ncbi:unnamed protein product [Arabidopsis halleri]
MSSCHTQPIIVSNVVKMRLNLLHKKGVSEILVHEIYPCVCEDIPA